MIASALRPNVKGSHRSEDLHLREATSWAGVYSLNGFTEDYLPGALSLEVVGCGLTTAVRWKADVV
jgi:hypothetical protein